MAHDPVVEEVGLHDAAAADGGAVADRDEVGLGQPVRLTPDAAADLRAQRAQPHVHHQGAARGPCEPRRGEVSTNVSETSLRQTNDDHSGCSFASMRPTHSHFAAVATPPATAPAEEQHQPAHQSPMPPSPVPIRSPRCAAERDHHEQAREPKVTITGTQSASSPQDAGHDLASLHRGSEGAQPRRPRRRSAQTDRRDCRARTIPPSPCCGVALSTATRPSSRHLAGRARSCRSCRGTRACRSSPRDPWIQPPPSS